ncbi:hypothetical protein HNY73_022830 [Argiope bruennichi]|uniref:Uncharacterized protein n=1 Tax=Argiope bruennichi TaxID=94029 RepID=A0A8T0E6E3_ARGBR|nr:hypothetical protein HNY73_022830 [Argiope bruennichi]
MDSVKPQETKIGTLHLIPYSISQCMLTKIGTCLTFDSSYCDFSLAMHAHQNWDLAFDSIFDLAMHAHQSCGIVNGTRSRCSNIETIDIDKTMKYKEEILIWKPEANRW